MGWPHLLLYLRTVDKNEQRTVYARSLLEITRSPGETDDSPLRRHATIDWVLASSSQHWQPEPPQLGIHGCNHGSQLNQHTSFRACSPPGIYG